MRLTLSLLICSFAFAQEPVRPGTPGGRELLAPPESEVFSFAVFSDRTGGRDSGLPILIQAVEDVNRFQPAFVMTVGDLINGYNDRLSWLAQMARYKTIMEDLTMPWYPVAGNHDVYGDGGSPADRGNLALYQEHFGPLYYSFDYKDVHFVVLYSDEALAFRNPAANQNMSEAQLLWLQADLEASDARAVYVFLHHPRWQEYYDGCNWPEVHAILAADGRVRTVFAGHMHAYRHDGWIDGIEYITLGMTGASGGSDLSLGELHHFNIVAVGPDSATMAVVPVGGTYARDFVTADQHRLLKGLSWYGCGRFIEDVRGPEGTLAFEAMNPAAVPLALELLVPGEEPRALMLEAGACARVELPARPFWEGAALTLRTTVVGDDGVPRVREHSARPPRRPRQRIPSATATSERVLVLDGEDSCLRLPPSASWQPISGLTVEMQVKAAPHGGRSGLVSKAENSAFGLFFGLAEAAELGMWVHDRGVGYGSAALPNTALLEPERWVHLAAVFESGQVRLYLDGVLAAEGEAGRFMSSNELPLFVGADTGAGGEPMSFFAGAVDDLRISNFARYTEDFTPPTEVTADEGTVGLYTFDYSIAGTVFDGSPSGLHGVLLGGARLGER